MTKITINRLKPLIKLKKNEYKYLSPHIFKKNKDYYLVYCNRKSPKKFQGEINFAKSRDLIRWKKISKIIIKPNPKKKIHSYISPAVLVSNKKLNICLEGQKKNSAAILFFQNNNNAWKQKKLEIFKGDMKKFYQSPFVYQRNKRKFLFYSYNKKKIKCLILNDKLKRIKLLNCFDSSLENEKFCIYSPSIIRFKNNYYMFYAAWKNKDVGNVNIAFSNNLIKWKKIKKNIFKIKSSIKIISEPFLFKKDKKIFLFFEYKKKSYWNISYKSFNFKEFNKIVR